MVRIRPILLLIVTVLIITKVVFLSPSPLEETKLNVQSAMSVDELVLDQGNTLIPDLPRNRVAEYSIEKFSYVAVQKGVKQWKINATHAFMYNPEKLVHARGVTAFLFDPQGKMTLVTGQEARYSLNEKNLEIYGNVKTIFPDGFELLSEYLHYAPLENHILIPKKYIARGQSKNTQAAPTQSFSFTSRGLDYSMRRAQITLMEDVHAVFLKKAGTKKGEALGVPDQTTIESDCCQIDRNKNLAHFTMNQARPLRERFVHIVQPTLFSKCRTADLNYGDFSQVLQYLTAHEDVLIKETGKDEALRYATGGRADFDTRRDIIVLTEFPQAYQGQDTVTGDVILMHRDTDVIEIEQSNAYSSGLGVEGET
jgi:LPS export ABC transporter protein LptC